MSDEQRNAIKKALQAAVMGARGTTNDGEGGSLSLDAFPFTNTGLTWVNSPRPK